MGSIALGFDNPEKPPSQDRRISCITSITSCPLSANPQPRSASTAKLSSTIETLYFDSTITDVQIAAFLNVCWTALLTRVYGSSDTSLSLEVKYRDETGQSGKESLCINHELSLAASVSDSVARLEQQFSRLHSGVGGISREHTKLDQGSSKVALSICCESSKHGTTEAETDVPALSDSAAMTISCLFSCSGRIVCRVFYNDTTWTEKGAARALQQFANITRTLHESLPTASIESLNLFGHVDFQTIQAWNAVPAFPYIATIHDLFKRQARLSPEKIAVENLEDSLTYGQLDTLSSSLACYLTTKRVVQGTIVPLLFEKSVWAVVAMLAVLKAGGTFVGLCTSHPAETIHTIVKQTSASFVLVSESQVTRLEPKYAEIVAPARTELWTADVAGNIMAVCQPANIACVIFTSGSTGVPKGIELDHVALVTSMIEHGKSLQVHSDSRVLQFSSYAFDMSLYEIFTTLLAGGCVCIPSESERLNDLVSFINDRAVNWAFFTPSLLRNFQPCDVPSLRTVCIGGEPVGSSIVSLWSAKVQLITIWGPAEVTICASGTAVDGAWIPGTFGKAVGCTTWVTEEDDPEKLMPVGSIGEVLIEGPVVARGYFKNSKKTEEAFIPVPKWRRNFYPLPKYRRFFRTGDLVQYNTDGSLKFVSRTGTMVKINGQRVDVDAIEDVLRKTQAAPHLTVQAISSTSLGGSVLAAFLSSHKDNSDSANAEAEVTFDSAHENWSQFVGILQTSLLKKLPRYMVPRIFIPLSSIPVNRNGKIDRVKLKTFLANRSTTDLLSLNGIGSVTSETLFMNENEKLLHSLVAEVLQLDSNLVSIDRDFLQLGGDSLSAIRLANICRQHQMRITVETIMLQSLSLREVAARLAPLAASANSYVSHFSLIPQQHSRAGLIKLAIQQCGISTDDIQDIYPCTPMQEGLITTTLTSMQSQAYIDRLMFRLPEHVDMDLFIKAWTSVVTANDILRARIILTSDGKTFNVVVAGNNPEWRQYWNVDEYLSEDRKEAMGLGGPLLRMSIIGNQPGSIARWFAITVHHALYDGWSLPLLLQQAESSYQQRDIPEHHFSAFVQHVQNSGDLEASRLFWKSDLTDLNTIAFPEYPSASHSPVITSSLKKVHKLKQRTDSFSMATKVQFAWALLLSLYTGSEDVTYGLVLNGRMSSMPTIADVTGPTVTTVPFRTIIKSGEAVEEGLKGVQLKLASVVPHSQMGLQHIARLGENLATACKFRNLVVIQQPSTIGRDGMFKDMQEIVGGSDAFPGYGLILICHPRPEDWALEFLFDSKVLTQDQVNRMSDQLTHLLHEIDCDRSQMVNSMCLVSPGEAAQISWWNSYDNPRTQSTIHEMFGQRCRAIAGAVAVEAWDGTFSYSDLDSLSSFVSTKLRNHGVSKGAVIPILIEKSRWVVVAMLAVMKAGGAFTLLDTSQSSQRHEEICAAVAAKMIITSKQCAARSKLLASVVYLVNDESFTPGDLNRELQEIPQVAAEDLLYVTFTSGSTGKPKGVMIEHGSYCSAILAQRRKLHISTDSRILQLSSYAFDSFAVEILTAITTGSCVCIPSEDSCSDIAQAICTFSATWLCITPSMLRLLKPEDVSSLKTVVAVGESMVPEQITLWARSVDLICGYGPSECSTGASAQPVMSSDADPRNIGSGMGAHLWIAHRDNHNTLMPIGTIGELIIAGPIVGRGYLHEAEKTEAVFLESTPWLAANPHVHRNRLYKTGDLARYNEDGTCTYLGRKDQQLKLRGQRLDIIETERHLRDALKLEVVADVIRPHDSDSHPFLIAFIETPYGLEQPVHPKSESMFLDSCTVWDKQIITAEAKLRKTLPAVAVPSLYLRLRKMPLTTSGKINRRTLSSAATSQSLSQLCSLGSVTADIPAAPLGDQETTALFISGALSNIMASRNQNKQSLFSGRDVVINRTGLDSIDAIALSRIIAQKFDTRPPLQMLFDSSTTIRDIAHFIDEHGVHKKEPLSCDLDAEFRRLSILLQQEIASQLSQPRRDSIESLEHRPTRIFLTGSTGFLGTHILQQIIQDARVDSVTVLVNATTIDQAVSKVIKSAEVAGWWRESYLDRIDVWMGDLAKPRLGLTDAHWNVLCGLVGSQRFDSIIHNGAVVHWGYDYDSLKPVNVMSTFYLLSALSQASHGMSFTYVSALAPGTEAANSRNAAETISSDGYSQTKYVSELLIHCYQEHCTNTSSNIHHSLSIIRPGLIIGSAASGVANADDYLWRIVSGALSIGAMRAEDSNSWIFLSTVEMVASLVLSESLTTISCTTAAVGRMNKNHFEASKLRDGNPSPSPPLTPNPGSSELGDTEVAKIGVFDTNSHKNTQLPVNTISIWDGLHAQTFWNSIMVATGISLQNVSSTEWLSRIHKRITNDRDKSSAQQQQHPVYPVLSIFEATDGKLGMVLPDEQQRQQPPTMTAILRAAVVKNVLYLTEAGVMHNAVQGTAAQGKSRYIETEKIAEVFRRTRRLR